MNSTLESIASSSLALLSTLQAAALEAPIPGPPAPSTSQVLTSLRADLATLSATLAHVHTTTVARRKAVRAPTPNESAAAKAEREARLRERVDQLRVEVEQAKEKVGTRRKAVEALNGAWTVEEVLRSAVDDEGLEKRRLQLERKDELALQLLTLRSKNEKAAAERARLRKRMFGLTRENASLTDELRQAKSIEGTIIEQMPKDVHRKYIKLVQDTTSLISRHAIIRNVFQLVVVESGVSFYTTRPEGPDDGMSTAKLQRLMLEAGDGREHLWDEREQEEIVEEEQEEEQEDKMDEDKPEPAARRNSGKGGPKKRGRGRGRRA
ncbi:hypothetical protein RQP46_003802 [Phenoliferia psychrophenolica]